VKIAKVSVRAGMARLRRALPRSWARVGAADAGRGWVGGCGCGRSLTSFLFGGPDPV